MRWKLLATISIPVLWIVGPIIVGTMVFFVVLPFSWGMVPEPAEVSREFAVMALSPGACIFLGDESDRCLNEVSIRFAGITNNAQFCKINGIYRSDCVTDISLKNNDVEMCDLISSKYVEICIVKHAVKQENFEFCQKLDQQYQKERCENSVYRKQYPISKNPEICYKMHNESAQNFRGNARTQCFRSLQLVNCVDSDNGQSVLEKGTTILYTEDNTIIYNKTDFCREDSTLIEYVCKDNRIFDKKINCYCQDGQCQQHLPEGWLNRTQAES